MVDLKPSPLPEPAATGTLAQKPLAHLLIYALERRLTGTLEVRGPSGDHAFVVLADGLIAKVETSEPIAYLGRVLFELGYVDDATLGRSLTELASTRRLHGVLLREHGAVTEAQLQHGLRELRLRKLHHAFTFPPASTFAFYNKIDLVGDRPGDVEPIDPIAPTWRGIRELPPTKQVRATLARVEGHALRVQAGTKLDPFEFQEDERAAAECLRLKALTVPELTSAGFLSPTATELLVYALLITRHVEIVVRSETSSSAPPPAPVVQPSSVPPRPAASAFGSGQYAKQVSFSLRAAAAEGAAIPTPPPPPRSTTPPRGSREGEAFFAQAEMNLALKDYGEAEALCRKALLATPGRADIVALLAWCEANDPRKTSREHTRAQVMALDRALASDPTARRAHYYRGELYRRLGENDSALRDYKSALELDPDDVEASRAYKVLDVKMGGRTMSPAAGTKKTDPPKHTSGLFEKPKK
jgi:hypothetical protein